MKTNASDVADFYHQLALLIKARLPLPDSLRQLGQHFPKRDFQKAILEIGELSARGEKFSEVVKKYPRFFSQFHVQLISAGEASGTLPEVLFAVARFARFQQIMAARMRDVLAYPLFIVHFALLVIFFASAYVLPAFMEMYEGLGFTRLPFLTRFLFHVTTFIRHYRPFVFVAYPVFLAFSVWLFTPGFVAQRAMLNLIDALPGSRGIAHSLDSARLCSMWSTLLKSSMPLPDVMDTAAQLVERTSIKTALVRVAQGLRSGTGTEEALSREREIDSLIVLTFSHTPEDELAVALERLGHLYEYRIALTARSAIITWTVIGFLLMTVVVAAVVLGMFAPVFQLHELVM